MPSFATDALILVRELLLLVEEEGPFLATAEEAAYFRKRAAKALAPPPALSLPPSPPPVFEKKVVVQEPKETPPPLIEEKTEAPSAPFSSFKRLCATVAPDLLILEEIPSDALARKIASRWKAKNQTSPLSLLSLAEPPEQRIFLEEMARALDVYFGPARLIPAEPIEREKQWEAFLSAPELKLIIACDYTLWQLSSLRPFYRENPAQGARTLGTVPLFLLPDLSLYFKDPLLKRSLWKALKQLAS